MPTKRSHHIIIALALTTLLSISTAKALTIDVSVEPPTILPAGSVRITVVCDSEGEGKIWVKPPDGGGPATSVDISFPPEGGEVSKVYPDDFGPEASTTILGEYKVHVVVHDRSAAKSFWVFWQVVPTSPIGSIGSLLALFAAFGTYALTKRKTLLKL